MDQQDDGTSDARAAWLQHTMKKAGGSKEETAGAEKKMTIKKKKE